MFVMLVYNFLIPAGWSHPEYNHEFGAHYRHVLLRCKVDAHIEIGRYLVNPWEPQSFWDMFFK